MAYFPARHPHYLFPVTPRLLLGFSSRSFDQSEARFQTEPKVDEEKEKNVEKSRVLVVSNRLPIRARRDLETGRWTFNETGGGLVTAMQGVRNDMNFLWIGWVGVEVEKSEHVSVQQNLSKSQKLVNSWGEREESFPFLECLIFFGGGGGLF